MEIKIRPKDTEKPTWFYSAHLGKSTVYGDRYGHLEVWLYYSSPYRQFGDGEHVATFKWQCSLNGDLKGWYGLHIELESEMAVVMPFLAKLAQDVPYLSSTNTTPKQVMRSIRRRLKAHRFVYDTSENRYRHIPRRYREHPKLFWHVQEAIA